MSELDPFEDPFRDVLDDEHDAPPEPRQVHDAAAPVDGAHDATGDRLWTCPQGPFLEIPSHGRVHETRLDGDHGDAGLGEALSQSAQVGAQGRLRRTIYIVALAAAVA